MYHASARDVKLVSFPDGFRRRIVHLSEIIFWREDPIAGA